MSEEASTTPRYQAVPHHWIQQENGDFLFEVDAMRVHDAVALDRFILKAAAKPRTMVQLRAGLSDLDQAEVVDRIELLLKAGVLLPDGAEPDRAPTAAPTDYATFMVNVSQRCNLTCSYCYVNKGHFDYAEKPIPKMPVSDAQDLVDRLYENFPGFHIYGYHFYGGEPLLNFEAIRTIVEHAERKAETTATESDYHITTNGTLLTPEIAHFMDEHRFTVYYSIDSSRETHDEFRRYLNGRGSYADVDQNLDLLRAKKGVHLIGSSVVREGNTLGAAIKCLEDKGARQCKAERVRLHDDDPLALVGPAFDTYLHEIRSLAHHYIVHLERGEKPLDYRLTSKILQLLTRKRRDFFCPAGERMFGIASNGELYPCALHVGRPRSKIGHVATGADTGAVGTFRQNFGANGQAACRSCWNRTLCGGGCSAMMDRFGHEKCDLLCAESEAALVIFHHFARTDPIKLLALVSPKIVQWAEGALEDEEDLALTEPAAELDRGAIDASQHA